MNVLFSQDLNCFHIDDLCLFIRRIHNYLLFSFIITSILYPLVVDIRPCIGSLQNIVIPRNKIRCKIFET